MSTHGGMKAALALAALLGAGASAGWLLRGSRAPGAPGEIDAADESEVAAGRARPDGAPARRRRARVESGGPSEPDARDPDVPRVKLPPPPPAARGEIVGRVMLAPTYAPVEGVVLDWAGGSPGARPTTAIRSAPTGPDGVFRMPGFPPGEYWLEARMPGRPSRRFPVVVPVDDGADGADVTFGDGGVVTGRVHGPAGPLGGLEMHVSRFGPQGKPYVSARTDSTGTYRIDDMPPGKWVVWYRAEPGQRTAPAEVVGGTTTQVDFDLAASFAGCVTLDGKPIDSGSVAIVRDRVSASGQVGEDGVFRLINLAPGPGVVQASVGGERRFNVVVQPVTLQPGENRLDIQLGEGELSGEVTGNVRFPGERKPGAEVHVHLVALLTGPKGETTPGASAGFAHADGKGAFRIAGLRAGRYRVSAREFDLARPGAPSSDAVDIELDRAERRTGVALALPDSP